ncbi:MAG: vanomycin resistance protein VanB [Veillonellaceae bacterium]|nr:vanomycin resistance protein VanB [Veillonellaceae bacterium]
MRMSTNKDIVNIVLFLGIIALFSSISLFATNMAFMVTDKVYNGVMVGDIAVGGLSVKEAEEKIEASFRRRLNDPPIILNFEGNHWKIGTDEIKWKLDTEKLAQQAYNVGRRGNLLQQFQERFLTINGGYKVPLAPLYNKEQLSEIIASIADEIDREPHDAKILLDGLRIIQLPDTSGRKVAIDQLTITLHEKLNVGFPVIVDIPVTEVKPKIQTIDIEEIDSIISMYTTQFNLANENRVLNIALASNSISGTLLRPGEVFSFNDLVGLRIAEFGYREAPVFIEGKIVPDFGGGVCQVSSTLYNAVLLADMKILERSSHFRPPGYVPLGQDATVADNLLDFKFSNVLPHNIYILSQVSKDSLTVYILSRNNPSRPEVIVESVKEKVIEPNTIIKQDPRLDYGKQIIENMGQKGFVVSTYRVKRLSGKEVEREHLFTDKFKPDDRVVRVGTKVSPRQAIK